MGPGDGGNRPRLGLGELRRQPPCPAALTHLHVIPPLQALPRAAAADGVDPGGRGTRRPPPQLLHGQRRRPPGGPAAAARRGLRAAPAQVGRAAGRREGAPFPDTRPARVPAGGRKEGSRRQPAGLGTRCIHPSSLSPAGRFALVASRCCPRRRD